MSTTVTHLEETIAQCKASAEAAKNQLLVTFAHVPDDKLNWSPSPTCRTPLQIVAHCGMANQAFATILAGEELQFSSDPEEAAKAIREAGKDIASREAAVKLIEDSTARVLAALDKATPELYDSSPMSPFGPFPYPAWMSLPGDHMGGHTHQIDYLQTIWGDMVDHR